MTTIKNNNKDEWKEGGVDWWMGAYEMTYLGLPFADASMRSRWEGGGDGRGVTLFGWTEEK